MARFAVCVSTGWSGHGEGELTRQARGASRACCKSVRTQMSKTLASLIPHAFFTMGRHPSSAVKTLSWGSPPSVPNEGGVEGMSCIGATSIALCPSLSPFFASSPWDILGVRSMLSAGEDSETSGATFGSEGAFGKVHDVSPVSSLK